MDVLLVALFGLLAGALVNLLADGLPNGRWLAGARYPDGSARPPLAWLGIAAFACGLRRPRPTDSLPKRPLSWRYPLAEVATSGCMTLAYAVGRDLHSAAGLAALILPAQAALLVLIAVIDIERRQIVLRLLLACVLLALVRLFAQPQAAPTLSAMFAGALAAGLAFSLVYLGGRLFAGVVARQADNGDRATAFGFGDVYLMTVGGFILGLQAVPVAMTLAILLGGVGAAACLAAQVASGGYRRFIALPYAPYIAASIYVVMLLPREALEALFGI